MTASEQTRYGALLRAIINQATSFTDSGLPAEKSARMIADATTVRRPRASYTIGRDAAILTRLPRLFSDRLLDRMTAAGLRPYFPS